MKTSWFGWALSIIVLVLLFLIGFILKNPARLMISGERAKGIVVAMDTSSGEDLMLAPIVEFVTSGGERVTFTSGFFSTTPTARLGESVHVAYDRKNPHSGWMKVNYQNCAPFIFQRDLFHPEYITVP